MYSRKYRMQGRMCIAKGGMQNCHEKYKKKYRNASCAGELEWITVLLYYS